MRRLLDYSLLISRGDLNLSTTPDHLDARAGKTRSSSCALEMDRGFTNQPAASG